MREWKSVKKGEEEWFVGRNGQVNVVLGSEGGDFLEGGVLVPARPERLLPVLGWSPLLQEGYINFAANRVILDKFFLSSELSGIHKPNFTLQFPYPVARNEWLTKIQIEHKNNFRKSDFLFDIRSNFWRRVQLPTFNKESQ